MKHKMIAIGVLMTLMLQTTYAQKRLSPSIRVLAENWTYSMVKSMHTAGFDMPTMHKLPKASGSGGQTPAQLDSTLSFFQYDPGAASDSTPLVRTTLRYPAPGVKEETEYRWENEGWALASRTTYTTDVQQRLIAIVSERFDDVAGALLPDSRLEVFPHKNDPELIDSLAASLWNTTLSDWAPSLQLLNRFGAQDQLQESISWVDNFGDPMVFREVYTYDGNGFNTQIEEFRILNNQQIQSSLTNIMYGSQGLPIEYMVSMKIGSQLLPVTRTNIAYYVSEAVRKQMDFERDQQHQVWRLVQTLDYTYNNDQQLIARERTRHKEEERYYEYFVYNMAGDLYHITNLHWDDDLFDWKLDGRKYHYYGGTVGTDQVVVKSIIPAPNPASDQIQLPAEEMWQVRLVDQQGVEVKSLEYHPGEWLPVSDLPNGLYVILARSGKEQFSGKLVKQDGN
ncbi:MAG TPA: T9SS type A sorting domain-containing protein [Saprospiraceae bacterium]|nr:T9SS type A sorting domain-containing protein [Saprospiraceae bacterium]